MQDNNGDKTVLDSVDEFNVKHPLNSKWTLWYTKPKVSDSEEWSDLLRPVIKFGTVEEFWGIYNSVPKASDLPIKADYHLFRDDIRPEWEDERNSKGGRWSYQFRRKRDVDINELWIRTLLSAVGETIEDDENEVNGIVLNVRKSNYRVGVWTKSTNADSLKSIGHKLKLILKLDENDHVEFISHADSSAPAFIV